MTRAAKFLVWVLLCLGARSSQAALVIDVSGAPGSGVTTWVFSGTSTSILGGTIRTGVGTNNFDVGDSFEPDVTGNFISNGARQNVLLEVLGSASITVGGVTRTITHVFLDDDGAARDDIGIRTLTALDFAAGQASSWTGSFTVAIDINEFTVGTYRLNTTQSNGGGFVFAGIDDSILNFSTSTDIPEPGTKWMCALGFAMVGCWVRARGRYGRRCRER